MKELKITIIEYRGNKIRRLHSRVVVAKRIPSVIFWKDQVFSVRSVGYQSSSPSTTFVTYQKAATLTLKKRSATR
jgi:hypothetical protein